MDLKDAYKKGTAKMSTGTFIRRPSAGTQSLFFFPFLQFFSFAAVFRWKSNQIPILRMKLTIAVFLFCATIGSIQSQGTTGNRPSFIQTLFSPIGQFFSIFRRPSRPSVSAAAAASSGSIDVSSVFTDPQAVQDSLNSINQIQAEPVVQTQIVTETMTVFSTIPSLERVTSVETMVEMTTQTVYETIKHTETIKSTLVMTEHSTVTHSTCSSSVASSKAAPSSSTKVSVSPSVVSTSVAVPSTKKARLAPYVIKRAVEIEASSL